MFLLFTILFNVLGNNPSVSGYQIGDKAADFSLKATDGKMISMSSFPKAKGYIIVFTCNHCPYAVMYEDRLNDLTKKYTSKGYQVIATNPNDPAVKPDDSYDKMIVRAKEKSFSFPYLFDEGQQIYPKFGATKTPHVFLLNQDKIVKYIGAIDNNAEDANAVTEFYLENAISALENGKDPNPATTKAIGCSIKVKK
jgi:peroxiredoxin